MCICAQPSPTGSTPDSYVVSLPGVEYVTVRARFTTRAPASPSRPRTTTAPTTPYAVHTPISLVPRLAELGLPSDAVEADRRIGQPQVHEPAADQPQVRDPGVRRVRIGPPHPVDLPAGDTASPAQNPSLSVRPVVRVVANVVVMWLASRETITLPMTSGQVRRSQNQGSRSTKCAPVAAAAFFHTSLRWRVSWSGGTAQLPLFAFRGARQSAGSLRRFGVPLRTSTRGASVRSFCRVRLTPVAKNGFAASAVIIRPVAGSVKFWTIRPLMTIRSGLSLAISAYAHVRHASHSV